MLTVVIPANDEEDAIVDTVQQIQRVLKKKKYEIIVVDDGSLDATGKRAADTGVRVISHPHNAGYGAAIKTGIHAAKYDTIVITDADGTYPNDQIPSLLEVYGKGFNMVVAARTGVNYHESALKSPMRIWLKWLVEFTAGRRIPDINSGLRIFSRKESIKYFSHLCNTFSFTTSLTLAYMMTGKFVAYLPVTYYKRIGKTKVRLFRDSLRTLQFIVQAIVYYNPLKIFVLLCGLVLFVSFICVVGAVIFRSLGLIYAGIGGVLMAVQIFSLGLLAELLKQIMSKE